jgi:hypothetical protein
MTSVGHFHFCPPQTGPRIGSHGDGKSKGRLKVPFRGASRASALHASGFGAKANSGRRDSYDVVWVRLKGPPLAPR